jgi:hypothetical protein
MKKLKPSMTHVVDWNGQCVLCGADTSRQLNKTCPVKPKPRKRERP